MLPDIFYLSWFDICSFISFLAVALSVVVLAKKHQHKIDLLDKSSQNSLSSISSTVLPPSPTDLCSHDEYHEDEDSLSLDNLFPCDQTEIYASKKISYIIEELVQTEASYVDNLKLGLKNYANIYTRDDLPYTLKDTKIDLLGNIEEILYLHEKMILPMMLRNQRDLKKLFDDFSEYFDKNSFYCYVTFTINKKTSMELRQDHREYFKTLQTEFNDKLGIDSFLVQPIQRLTRYPLLLQQLISLNILQQGYFRKSNEFDAYNHKSRKKYRCKVFLFDKCLLCTEVKKKRLAYRCHFSWDSIEVTVNNSKSIVVTHRIKNRPEYEFYAAEAYVIKQWMRCIGRISVSTRERLAIEGNVTIPMEVVLIIGIIIWIMFRLL
ncbi:pleckstrin homology domain-containing family G member 4B isoform X2 [Episyrphus balteatus]|uniref:pleckstrin homology domain-containing family G member 4B isoform X2 n=1 Tax=Episyrphus balteatus TaxID=286459 RepID=UPI002486A4AF|nr:pleckstrin homology domain-containing family G member 4B isoform X2 [Episyrphus balteatus]